jgi:hypothetical protein
VVDAPTNTMRIVLRFLGASGRPRQPISFVTSPSGVVTLGMKR